MANEKVYCVDCKEYDSKERGTYQDFLKKHKGHTLRYGVDEWINE